MAGLCNEDLYTRHLFEFSRTTQVKQKLQDRATDLGAAGFDNLFGYGLVNAFSAVQP